MELNFENMHVTPLSDSQAVSINGGSWTAFKWILFVHRCVEELIDGIQEGWSDADKSVEEQFSS